MPVCSTMLDFTVANNGERRHGSGGRELLFMGLTSLCRYLSQLMSVQLAPLQGALNHSKIPSSFGAKLALCKHFLNTAIA